jgi:hypothetical protein
MLTEEYTRHRYVGLIVTTFFISFYFHIISSVFSDTLNLCSCIQRCTSVCSFFHSARYICVLSSIQQGTSVFCLPFSGVHLCRLFHSAGHICVFSSIQQGISVFFLPFSGAHLHSIYHLAGHQLSGKIKNLITILFIQMFRLYMGQGKCTRIMRLMVIPVHHPHNSYYEADGDTCTPSSQLVL